MPDKTIPLAEYPRVIDHRTFGEAVVRWALMRPEDRPTTFGELQERFPQAHAAMSVPDHVTPDHRIDMVQATTDSTVVNLPPIHKLLPMFEYLGVDWRDVLPAEAAGFVPEAPPSVPTVPGAEHYGIPDFFFTYVDEVRAGGSDSVDYEEFFLKVVGFYSVAGCR